MEKEEAPRQQNLDDVAFNPINEEAKSDKSREGNEAAVNRADTNVQVKHFVAVVVISVVAFVVIIAIFTCCARCYGSCLLLCLLLWLLCLLLLFSVVVVTCC